MSRWGQSLAAASCAAALFGAGAAAAGDYVYRPVQAVVHTIGDKLVVGDFVSADGACRLEILIMDAPEVVETLGLPHLSPARLRIALRPEQIVSVDSPAGGAIRLTCDAQAATLLVGATGTEADAVAAR